MRALVSGVAGIAAAAATAYLVWVELHPEDGTRKREITCLVVVGLVAVGSSLARPLRIFTVERMVRERDKVAVVLRGLTWTVHMLTGGTVPFPPLGASAWVVAGWWPFRHLHRISHERVSDASGPSGIWWTKGKGIIGHCWATGRGQIVDSGAFDQVHDALTREEWGKLDTKARRGMSYKDYKKIRGKYGTVIAVPMFDQRDHVIGVISLDAPTGHHGALTAPGVIEAIWATAGVVAKLLD